VSKGAKESGQLGAVFSKFWIVKLCHSSGMPPLSLKEKLSGQQEVSTNASAQYKNQRIIRLN
jgi:hypothetical protein